MAEDNKKLLAMAEEARRAGAIRSELQRLGVAKVDLAFRAVQDCIVCTEDGRLMAGEQTMKEYLWEFIEVLAGADCRGSRDYGEAEGCGDERARNRFEQDGAVDEPGRS